MFAVFATICAFTSGVLASIAIYRTFYETELQRLRAMLDEQTARAEIFLERYLEGLENDSRK